MSELEKKKQLPLGVGLRDDATFESYFVGPNDMSVSFLNQLILPEGEQFVFLWGPKGVGKTHLCHALTALAIDHGQTACTLPLKEWIEYDSQALEGLNQLDIVCLDDIEVLSGKPDFEEVLFNLFNHAREDKHPKILFTSLYPPNQLNSMLADLKSRLTSAVIFHLHSLSDEEKLQALQQRARLRGLILADEVGWFLLKRCPRNMHDLFACLEQLDEASLVLQRKITIPFVKSVLNV